MDRSFLTDNPKLVDEIVCEVKSQGVFDQFRRNCIADVDTKPAYQNLRQRVENIVSNFLSDQVWRPDLNKNQLREKLRKHITEAGFLETGVERIVDQVVNPKINSVFLPKIEDISYKYLGIEKPKPSNDQTSFKTEPLANEDIKQPINLPPDFDDLEAVSPDSSGSKKSFKDSTENLDTSIDPDSIKTELNDSGDKVDDDFESPAFEPLKGSLLNESDSINGEEDSKLSDISGLTSQDSVKSEQNGEQNCEQPIAIPEPEIKAPTIEVIEQPAVTQSQQVIPENINQDSVLSQVSSNSHLSIVTDSNNKSSEVDICEEAQMPKFSENSFNNPVVDDSERKPLMTVFDIKQDEIKFEGTERRSSLHDLSDDLKVEEDIVMEQLPEPEPPADSVGDESLMKTESSSSCMDPIISETKDLSLKDDGRSSENEFKDKEFKFEEPVVSADTTDASVGVSSSQTANDRHKSKDLKGERKSDSRSEHKSYRRDKDKSSHHSRDRHKDGKHSSSSSSKHSSSSSSSRKEHRSESRETNKTTSSDHRRDESSKSTDRSSGKSQSSSSRDKDSNYKSSRSHEDKDKNRSRHDRSSNKSRTHHRDDKKRQSQDDDENDKRKPGQESETKSKANDDHGVHHEKPFERRRSTDRDSDDGTMERGKPTSTTRPVASVNSSAITNSASSSSFSSTTSSCTDEYEKRGTSDIQKIAADSNVHTSSTDSDDGFVPTSTPVVVDDILIRSDINLEMLMETNSMETTDETSPIMSMMQQSLSDDAEMKLKKPKVASNIFEARKLMKVRKQMERDKKKRLEKLLVHSKQVLVGCNNVDEQGVELEFSVMNSSAPSISSPIKSKEVAFEGHQVPAPVNEKRNSGEFIIDMNEMKEMEKQMKKKRAEKQPPAPKFVHKFDEILSQIDKPRKRDSKGNQSPISPGHEKSPKYSTGSQERPKPSEPMPRKYAREQSKETLGVDSKKPATITSPPIQQRDEKRTEKAAPVRPQDGSKSRKNSSSSKSPPTPHSPTKMEHKIAKLNRMPEKATKSSSAPGAASSSKHEKVVTPTKQKEIKIDGTPKTTLRPEDIPKVTADTSTKSNIDLVDENEPDFFGFSECVALLDFAQIKQILSSKSQNRTLHLLNYDKSMSDIFSQYSTNIIDVTGSVEQCATNDKLPGPNKSAGVAGSQTKGTRKSTTSKNGVRATPQSQHKLFIENNQFADKSDVKQISRKRRTSNVAHGSAAKIVRLVDSKVSGDEAEETSPTPSEQSKENQIVQQIKRHNRSTDISCTSNAEIDQQPGEKSEPTKSNPNQRYASDDLYKPRPILSRSRRRGIENGET